MSSSDKIDPNEPPISADQLRLALLQEKMKEFEKEQNLQAEEQKRLAAFTEDFLKNQVTEEEIAVVRRLVTNAVKTGKYEALVYSFPSDLCTDSGRAIKQRRSAVDRDTSGKGPGVLRKIPQIREAAGLQAQGNDRKLSQRHARRRRIFPELVAGHEMTRLLL